MSAIRLGAACRTACIGAGVRARIGRHPEVVVTPGTGPRIAGFDARCALGDGIAALRDGLRAGRGGLAPDAAGRIVGAMPVVRDPAGTAPDPRIDAVAAVVATACADAGLAPACLADPDTVLVVASTKGDIRGLDAPPGPRSLGPFLQRIRDRLGHRGHAELVSCACASGGVAVARAARLLAAGWGCRAVVLGADWLGSFVLDGFSCLGAMSAAPARPFDDARDGMSVGEAIAALVLVDDDLPGVRVTASGQAGDAFTIARPADDGAGLALAVGRALEAAGAGAVDAICAHGTATVANDAMEAAAFLAAFGGEPPPVFGIKGAIGHTLGCAGVIETIACALALRDGFLPGTVGFGATSSGLDVTTTTREGAFRRLLNVNSGFGGINVALVLDRVP